MTQGFNKPNARKLNAHTSIGENHPLASSFLHPPPPDSQGKLCCSLYVSFPMPIMRNIMIMKHFFSARQKKTKHYFYINITAKWCKTILNKTERASSQIYEIYNCEKKQKYYHYMSKIC